MLKQTWSKPNNLYSWFEKLLPLTSSMQTAGKAQHNNMRHAAQAADSFLRLQVGHFSGLINWIIIISNYLVVGNHSAR